MITESDRLARLVLGGIAARRRSNHKMINIIRHSASGGGWVVIRSIHRESVRSYRLASNTYKRNSAMPRYSRFKEQETA